MYIAPLKALVRERMEDWKVRIEQKLGKKSVQRYYLHADHVKCYQAFKMKKKVELTAAVLILNRQNKMPEIICRNYEDGTRHNTKENTALSFFLSFSLSFS